MPHLDRLSSLISHFEIHTERSTSVEESNLIITGELGNLKKLILLLKPHLRAEYFSEVVTYVTVDIGGKANPLFQALPDCLEVDLTKHPEIKRIANLIVDENITVRCGGKYALDRLCELLVVSLLRHRIEQQGTEPGLFAGLAHPKLSHVMVAIHDDPGRQWHVDQFLEIAGMSRSQFMAEFQSIVGTSPIAYLKQWRMILARAAILKGDRIKEVSRRFGYGSGESFCRAFINFYGIAPSKLRHLE